MTDKDKFIMFLKKHKALTKFKNNLKQEGLTFHKFIITFGHTRKYMITFGFSWNRSPESFAYWSDLDDKWQKFIKNRK
ncbi:MAG: hypothetical protein ACYDBX_02350 [Patescibacteria group bacterium]